MKTLNTLIIFGLLLCWERKPIRYKKLWFALISHLIGRSWHNEHSKIILTVHGFVSHMLIIALRNNTVCFGVFMPGSPQTEPAWLSRPVWLIGLLRSSNTATFLCNLPHNNFVLQVEIVCCTYYHLCT